MRSTTLICAPTKDTTTTTGSADRLPPMPMIGANGSPGRPNSFPMPSSSPFPLPSATGERAAVGATNDRCARRPRRRGGPRRRPSLLVPCLLLLLALLPASANGAALRAAAERGRRGEEGERRLRLSAAVEASLERAPSPSSSSPSPPPRPGGEGGRTAATTVKNDEGSADAKYWILPAAIGAIGAIGGLVSYSLLFRCDDQTLGGACVALSVAKGVAYPIMKVTFIAMSEKILRATLASALPEDLYLELEARVFDVTPAVTSVYLLRPLTFYQAFALCAALVLFISIVLPLSLVLRKDFLNKQEVRRLQSLIVQKIIVESNSVKVTLPDATNLLHTRMAAVERYVAEAQFTFYDDFSSIFVGLLLFMLLAWDLGLVTLVCSTLIMTATNFIYVKLSGPWPRRREDREATVNARILDLVVCRDVIKTHGQELEERRKFMKMIAPGAFREETRVLARATFVSQFFQVFTFTLIVPCLFVFVYAVDPSLTRVFQLLIIIVVLDDMMRAYVQHLSRKPLMEAYERAKDEFCHALGMEKPNLFPRNYRIAKSGQVSVCDPLSIPKAEPVLGRNDGNSVDLDNVTLGYTLKNGTTLRVIENFSASFRLGERYAIMGETGAGKSTVFKGLAGLLKPIEGAISVSGDKVDTTSIEWRRDNIGVVSQESIMFNRSLRENLSYGLDGDLQGEELDALLLEALDKVNMKRIVLEQLPNGLDTEIVGNGSEFSGGQRQRLQIGRLLLRNRPFVLLDEFTSALDQATTQDILKVLDDFLSSGKDAKTLIMVTHDIQTLDIARHALDMKLGGKYEMHTTDWDKVLARLPETNHPGPHRLEPQKSKNGTLIKSI